MMVAIGQKLKAYGQLMRLNRPIGSLLLLWPTLWALWLAAYQQSLMLPASSTLLVFIVGVLLMRSAGCIINDYADRQFDGHVQRTADRPLVTHKVSTTEAKILFVFLLLLAFLLVLTQNQLTIAVSLIAVLLACCYPFMKRFTHLPQLVLGLAYSCSIPMAYAAVTNQLPVICWLLFIANVCWVIAYDTQYAMVDKEDDLQIGIKSTAILFGQYDKLSIGILQLTMLLLLVMVGFLLQLTNGYYAALLVVLCLFVYQQKRIAKRDRQACFRAFLHNNYVGMMIFIGILLN